MNAAVAAAAPRSGRLERHVWRLGAMVPIRRRAFWATQALVLLIAGSHSFLELFVPHAIADPIRFVPVSLFIIPVVYAALNFGLAGSLPTALWCFALTVPNAILWHSGSDWVAEIWQAGMVIAVGALVGPRIDRERGMRAEVDLGEMARRSSEEKYRRLFDRTTDAILQVDQAGTIEEANDAAARLFQRAPGAIQHLPAEALEAGELAAMLAGAVAPHPVAVRTGGRTTWINPVITVIPGPNGTEHVMAVLHDITLQVDRQGSLEFLARQTIAAREEERRRVARDLHDGPLQALVILCHRLDALAVGAAPQVDRQLGDVHHLAEGIADELRRFSRDLRPSLLDDLGLGAALRSEVAAFARRTGLRATYREHGDATRLLGETELMLLRIAQEALHNVERHGAATRVRLHLAFRAAFVSLTVADDGVGFTGEDDSVDLLSHGKLGLVGMRERALLAGGQLTVRSAPGRGTVVQAKIPATAGRQA